MWTSNFRWNQFFCNKWSFYWHCPLGSVIEALEPAGILTKLYLEISALTAFVKATYILLTAFNIILLNMEKVRNSAEVLWVFRHTVSKNWHSCSKKFPFFRIFHSFRIIQERILLFWNYFLCLSISCCSLAPLSLSLNRRDLAKLSWLIIGNKN